MMARRLKHFRPPDLDLVAQRRPLTVSNAGLSALLVSTATLEKPAAFTSSMIAGRDTAGGRIAASRRFPSGSRI